MSKVNYQAAISALGFDALEDENLAKDHGSISWHRMNERETGQTLYAFFWIEDGVWIINPTTGEELDLGVGDPIEINNYSKLMQAAAATAFAKVAKLFAKLEKSMEAYDA